MSDFFLLGTLKEKFEQSSFSVRIKTGTAISRLHLCCA